MKKWASGAFDFLLSAVNREKGEEPKKLMKKAAFVKASVL